MACALDPGNLDSDSESSESFDEAWQADLALIRELTRQEKQAEDDRILAARLAGVTLDEIPENVRKMAILTEDHHNTIKRKVIKNNATTDFTTKKTNHESILMKCAVCMELVSKNDPRVPCGHAYCIGCLKELFTTSMQDETLMPPRCCRKEIPTDLARLTLKETEDFNAKRLEYSTIDRLYCSQPTCSTFIPPSLIIDSIGTCPNSKCRTTTCAICKGASHGNLDCPKDDDTAALLAAAKEAGWTRCYRCRAVVELTHGCYHITCRCRAEFCYLCSTPWKNCPCAQWDEARLIEEARVRTARVPLAHLRQVNVGLNLQERVNQMVNQLRNDHECQHTAWAYTRGGGRCEECRDYLPQYLYRCQRCHLMACNRCRRNRF
ncbi:hypothetical protein I4U23_023566 [Adineta vaga]|nr:hypothetical protein I4U23_023566 [Adineta vaga]